MDASIQVPAGKASIFGKYFGAGKWLILLGIFAGILERFGQVLRRIGRMR